MSTDRKWQVGDHVSWHDGFGRHGATRHGTISAVRATSVSIVPDGGGRVVVRRRQRFGQPWDGLTHVTPDQRALQRWLERKPATVKHAYWDQRGVSEGLEYAVARLKTVEDIDRAIADLTALRVWIAERPVGA